MDTKPFLSKAFCILAVLALLLASGMGTVYALADKGAALQDLFETSTNILEEEPDKKVALESDELSVELEFITKIILPALTTRQTGNSPDTITPPPEVFS